MDDRHTRCIGPNVFIASFLVLLCVPTHIAFATALSIFILSVHVRVYWRGVLNLPMQTKSAQKQTSQIDRRKCEGIIGHRGQGKQAQKRKNMSQKKEGSASRMGMVYEIMCLPLLSI